MTINPKCFDCVHFNFNGDGLGHSCKAFDLIPDDIFFNEFDHTKKHPAQKNDILFEEIKDGQAD